MITSSNYECTDSSTKNGKYHDRSYVLEEVALVKIVARLEYDWREEDKEEHRGGKRLDSLSFSFRKRHHNHANNSTKEN